MTNSTSPNCRQSISIQDLLDRTIETDNGCLEWQMTRTKAGYGQIWLRGKMISVHREMTKLSYGEPDSKMMALHSCDNPPCINPKHLRWGTQSENTKQMWDSGRSAPITKPHPHRKLTYEIAQDIRQEYKLGLTTYKSLGQKYGVTDKTIEYLIKNLTYKL